MYSIKTLLLVALLLKVTLQAGAQQIINAYAEVTNITGNTLTIGNFNIANDQFEVGDQVILMQMQGDLTIDESNSSSFGAISGIGSAGLYEDLTIQSVTSGGIQTITEAIWEEDFEDQSPGTTVDNGETSWSVSYSGGGTIRVRDNPTINGNSLSGSNLDQEAVWTSGSINISGFYNVSITVDLAEVAFNQGADYIRVSYVLDGVGGGVQFANSTGNFNTAAASINGLSGSTLQVIVRMDCSRPAEFAIIDNITVRGDYDVTVPAEITLSPNWSNTYEIGANSAVQLISFPKYINFTTTDDLTGLDWDGAIGGVFAIDVENTLTLENGINLTGKGFRGGTANSSNFADLCNNNNNQVYRTSSNNFGNKGEAVYKNTNDNYRAGISHIASGGGGGSYHNAGGGGGGNFTAGGAGGPGWNEFNADNICSPSGGGYGGIDLSSHISADRIFLGGGGGGGQVNNSQGSDGTDGGGIIIIRAEEIETTGVCASLDVVSDGESGANVQADGGGGSGAGGSILFQVNTWTLDCDINVSASGGDGSSVTTVDTHGGGGGGGKGVIIFSGAMPISGFSANIDQGDGGSNRSGAGATSADSGSNDPSDPTADRDGIVENESGPLPIEMLYWEAKRNEKIVTLKWGTTSETNNDYFILEKSVDGSSWKHIVNIDGQGTTTEIHKYAYDDKEYGRNIYYRLTQVDFDGEYEVFDILYVKPGLNIIPVNVLVYPNPNTGRFTIQLPYELNDESMKALLFDATGRATPVRYEYDSRILTFNLSDHPKGLYYLKLIKRGGLEFITNLVLN